MSPINKTIKVLLMAVPMVLTLFSCSHEEEMVIENSSKQKVNLTIGFTLSTDIKTRDMRPLNSIDAWQRVSDMRVYVFRSDNEDGPFTLYRPETKTITGQLQRQDYLYIPAFEKVATEDNDGIWREPEDEEHTYYLAPMLKEGFYRLLAVGFDDPDKSPVKIDWKEYKTTWEDAILSNVSGTPVASEIFTGYPRDKKGNVETLRIDADTEDVEVEIICRRSVAGVLLYVKNIPSHYKAEYGWSGIAGGTGIITSDLIAGNNYAIYEVALVTVGYNPLCNAVSRHWEDDFKYDNSRFRLTRLASIELDPDDGDVENGYHREYFPAVGNFVMPSETYKAKDQPLIANYEGGMLEAEDHPLNRSLYLCFYTKTGSGLYYPLRLWAVKLVRSYTQDEDSEDLCAGDLNLQADNPFNYNLVANHLYCLGRYKDQGTRDDDKPVDLEKEITEHGGDNLIIEVLGNWQYEINIEM